MCSSASTSIRSQRSSSRGTLVRGDVDDAVEGVRELVRAEGKDSLVWWVEPAYGWLGPDRRAESAKSPPAPSDT